MLPLRLASVRFAQRSEVRVLTSLLVRALPARSGPEQAADVAANAVAGDRMLRANTVNMAATAHAAPGRRMVPMRLAVTAWLECDM